MRRSVPLHPITNSTASSSPLMCRPFRARIAWGTRNPGRRSATRNWPWAFECGAFGPMTQCGAFGPVTHRVGIAVQTSIFDRESHYTNRPPDKRDYPEGRFMLVWTKGASTP